MKFKHLALAFILPVLNGPVLADSTADLNDLEIAHVAYVADNIDIQYAHIALALSTNPEVREFANTMIRDHKAVSIIKKTERATTKQFPQSVFARGCRKNC